MKIFFIFLIFCPFIIFYFWLKKNIKNNQRKKEESLIQKQSTEKQERFKKFPPEIKWTIIKPFLDIFNSSVSNKMAILPSLSAIAVMTIIIATLRPELIPANSLIYIKIIISILFFLIPYCLLIYLLDVEDAAKRALKYYEEYTGSDLGKKLHFSLGDYIKGSSPMFIISIYTAIVIFLLEIIWGIF